MPSPLPNLTAVVECKGCTRNVPAGSEAVAGSIQVVCPVCQAHRLPGSDRGLPWPSTPRCDEETAGLTMDLNNNTPPYRHWHTCCAACGRVTLARPSNIPGPIAGIEPNPPTVKCQHCADTRQYLTSECFLAPLSAAGTEKPGGTLAVVAGLIAAVKLAKVESRETQKSTGKVLDCGLDHDCKDGSRSRSEVKPPSDYERT
jgi:hypothetical protein